MAFFKFSNPGFSISNTDSAAILALCLKPRLIVGILKLGASRMPELLLPIINLQFFKRERYFFQKIQKRLLRN